MQQEIAGYALEGELGRGAAGVVYRARDPRTGRPVALKLLTGTSSTAARRFQIEARALQRLDHDHLVRVFDAGDAHGRPFLVMELVDGTSLLKRLEEEGPFPPREAVTIARDVGRALAHAHQRGVIHRDVKPANVLLDRAGRARLGDFGLARELDASATRVTMEGALLGTPGYLPPEQVRGELARIGPPADVYALGATLYTLLVGEPPFASEALGALLEETLRERARAPSRRNAQVDARLDAIVLRCLEKEPERRYPHAGALADDLDRWLAGRRPVSLAALPALPQVRWRRLRLPALLAALLLVAAGALAERRREARARALEALIAEAEGWDVAREWGRAAEAADRALELDPHALRALSARILAWQFLAEHERAIADAERLLALAPDDPDALAAAIPALLDLPRARRLTEHGLSLAPRHPGLLRLRAQRRRNDRDQEGALADLRLAAEVAPGDAEIQTALSWTLRQSDPDGALRAAQRAGLLAPGRGDLQEQLGLLLEQRGDREGALRAYWQGARVGFYRAVWRLAELSLGMGRDLPAVEAHLSEWLERQDEANVRVYRGRTRFALGDLPGSEADHTRALELDPRNAEAAAGRALARFRQGNYAGAEADFDLAWRIGSNTVQLVNRGVCKLEQQRLQEAEADLRLATELEPTYATAHTKLAIALQRLGRNQEALGRFQRAIEVDPGAIKAYEGAARLLADQERFAEAQELLQRAQARLPASDPRREQLARQLAVVLEQAARVESPPR